MGAIQIEADTIVGSEGSLPVLPEDEIARKFLMIIEGECLGLGPSAAAAKYGYSRQRYYQLKGLYQKAGLSALRSDKRGPKRATRRTEELVRQVIRHRFLDPKAAADVIVQKLRQNHWSISVRSVQRILSEFGLLKKTARTPRRSRDG